MPKTLTLNCSYYHSLDWELELPEDRTAADIKEMFVKWDIAYITWTDGTESEIELVFRLEETATKRPISFTLLDTDENGDADWDAVILEA
mgnify:CR=1 FL=1